MVAKSKAGPHAWLSFRLGNSRPPNVNNHSPSAPAYTTTSDVVDLQYSANSETTYPQNLENVSEETYNHFRRRIDELRNSYRLTRAAHYSRGGGLNATSEYYRKHAFLQNVQKSSDLQNPTRRTSPRSCIFKAVKSVTMVNLRRDKKSCRSSC